MTSSRVARRYARALFQLAMEQGQIEPWSAELSRVAAIVTDGGLLPLLTSPELSEPDRITAMATVTERLGVSYPLRSFAVMLARNRRIGDLAAMSDAYAALLDQQLGRARATLTFAARPSDDEIARVVAGLESISGKKILPTIKIDSAVLGGIVVELEGKTYDASLATRLAAAERLITEEGGGV